MAAPDPYNPAPPSAISAAAYRVLATGSYARAASENPTDPIGPSVIAVAADDATYRATWERLIGGGQTPPPVDFSRESVVFLLLGTRSSGGYAIEPGTAEVAGDTATVTANVKTPERGTIATMAFTAPFAVVAIDRPGIGSAEWLGTDRREIARTVQ